MEKENKCRIKELYVCWTHSDECKYFKEQSNVYFIALCKYNKNGICESKRANAEAKKKVKEESK